MKQRCLPDHPSPNSGVLWVRKNCLQEGLKASLDNVELREEMDRIQMQMFLAKTTGDQAAKSSLIHPSSFVSKAHRVVIPGLVAIDVYQSIILNCCSMLYHSVIPFPWNVSQNDF